MSHKPVILITAADLAPQALALLSDHEVVFAGKAPTQADVVALARQHNPVAIIVRYSGVNAEAMDAAPALRVIHVYPELCREGRCAIARAMCPSSMPSA